MHVETKLEESETALYQEIDWADVGLEEWFIGGSVEVTMASLDDFEIQENESNSEVDETLSQLYTQAVDYEEVMTDLSLLTNQLGFYACMYHDHSGTGVFVENQFDITHSNIDLGIGGHEHHEHCEAQGCDGHYDQLGRCEKCGRFKSRF